MPTITFVVIITTLSAFLAFTEVYVMTIDTGGGGERGERARLQGGSEGGRLDAAADAVGAVEGVRRFGIEHAGFEETSERFSHRVGGEAEAAGVERIRGDTEAFGGGEDAGVVGQL